MPLFTARVTAIRSVVYAPVIIEAKDGAAAWTAAHHLRWDGKLTETECVDGTATVAIEGASNGGPDLDD